MLHSSSSTFSERLESGGSRCRAAADGRAGGHHRTEEPDRQQLGSGPAEVRRRRNETIHRAFMGIYVEN